MDSLVLLPFLPELLLVVLIWRSVLLLRGLIGMASSYFCSRFIQPGWFSGPSGVVILIWFGWDWSVFRFPFFRRRPLVSLAETVLNAAELEGRPLCIFLLVGPSFSAVLSCFTHVLLLLLPGLCLSWVMFLTTTLPLLSLRWVGMRLVGMASSGFRFRFGWLPGNLLLFGSDLFFLRSASLRRMLLVLLVETVSDAAGLVGCLWCTFFFLVGLSFGAVLSCFTHVLLLRLPGLWLSWVMF